MGEYLITTQTTNSVICCLYYYNDILTHHLSLLFLIVLCSLHALSMTLQQRITLKDYIAAYLAHSLPCVGALKTH